MKKAFFLILLFSPLLLRAQESKWLFYPSLGLDIGGTIPYPLSDIPEDTKGTPKINPSFGLGIERFTPGRWNLDLGVSYHVLAFSATAEVRSQSFYYNNHQDILYFTGHTVTDVRLSLLEFPVTAVYKLSPTSSLLIGAYYSRILSGTFATIGTDGVLSDDKSITDAAQLPGIADAIFNFNDYVDVWDAGMLLGYRYSFSHGFNLWGNLEVGFKSIFVSEFDNIDYDMYQVRLNIGVSKYVF
jgi:hypothetical protein